MANNMLKNAAAFVMMAAMVCSSCGKIAKEELRNWDGNISHGKETVERPAHLVEIYGSDPYERLVETGVEYGITVNFKGSDDEVKKETYKYVRPYVHSGVDAQYFEWEDVNFTTSRGQKDTLARIKEPKHEYFEATLFRDVQKFDAVNASKYHFEHSTTTGVYEVVFTFPDQGDVKGFSYKFEAPSYTVGMKQLENTKVSGVAYKEKVWDAIKYECEVPATFVLPYDLRVEGEEYEKTIEVSNVAFFLEHVIDVRLEVNYFGDFYTENKMSVKTREESIKGYLVTYDNGEPTGSATPVNLQMNLQVEASQPENSWVDTEEELGNEDFKFVKGEAKEEPMSEEVFTGKKVSREDSIVLFDRTINLSWEYMLWSWGEKVLTHATVQIDPESIKVNSEKDVHASKTSLEVYEVTVTADAIVSFVGVEREKEPYTIEVKFYRYRNVPDDIKEDFDEVKFGLELYNETPSKVASKREFVTVKKTVTNHGEPVSTSEKTHELHMWINLEAGDTVVVDKPHKPVVSSVEDKAGSAGWKQNPDEDGFDIHFDKASQLIRTKDGHAMTVSRYAEELTRNGKLGEYSYGFGEGLKSNAFTFAEPVLVDSVRTETALKKVYRVDVEIVPVVKTTEQATKAGNENVNTLTAVGSVYQMTVEGDTYIEGKDEVEEFVEPNNNGGIDAGIKLYEHYTLSGRQYVGEDRVSFAYDIVGGNESDVIVNSVSNLSQSGNGYSGLGSGTYTNYIVNGSDSYAQKFTYFADGSKTAEVKGKSGKGAKVTFTPSFAITDTGLTSDSQTTEGVYTVYPRYSNAKGTLSLKNVSVSKDATSSRNFKVKRDIPKIIPEDWGKIVSAGFSAVPAHLVNEGAGFVNGNVEDGSGAQTAATCMTLITDKGAAPVIFGWADAEPIVPTTAQILGSTFTAGSYDSSYNSGYYNTYSTSIGAMNRWVPAKAYDTGSGISYDVQGIPQIRYVRNEALVMWNWRGGNYSCMLPSYKCTVNDGTLTVTYNGKVVLEIR